MKSKTLIALLLIAATVSSYYQIAVPTLRLTTHPRYKGMGEAGAAIVEDAAATVYNPAGLLFVESKHKSLAGLYFDYENLIPEFNIKDYYHHNFSVFGRYKKDIALGITQKYVSNGRYDWTNHSGEIIGQLHEVDRYVIISAASGFGSSIYSLGANVKILNSTNYFVPVDNGLAFDAGFIYREPLFNSISLGLSLLNMGSDALEFRNNQDVPLPFTCRLSLAASHEFSSKLKLTGALDLSKIMIHEKFSDNKYEYDPFWKAFTSSWSDESSYEEKSQIVRSLGLEAKYANICALRFGWMIDKARMHFEKTFGIGLKTPYLGPRFPIVSVDFATIMGLESFPFVEIPEYSETPRVNQTQFAITVVFPFDALSRKK